MRLLHAVAAALLAAGCGARTGLPEDGPRAGGLLLTQGTLSRSVSPVERHRDAVAFYDYVPFSGHTGFEALGKSELFFYRDLDTGIVSLVTEHGIAPTPQGPNEPAGQVDERFTGLPPGVAVVLSDDAHPPSRKTELVLDSPTSAAGAWHFSANTDGGVLSGFPLPGRWSVEVTADFLGIDGWRFFGPEEIPLALTEPVTLTAFE